MIIACLIGVIWIGLQARLEELDVLQRLSVYKNYMEKVPRFVSRSPG
jgi:protein-S-isoprenylcysteine O-methyltransferase Ste14